MQFLCAIFSHLRLICQPACVSVYIYLIAAALGHCSESSLSHLSFSWPLQRGSLGQESSCQNPGKDRKGHQYGGGGQRVSTPWHDAAGKEWDSAGRWTASVFSFHPGNTKRWWLLDHSQLNIPVQNKQCFFWKYTMEESGKDLCK